MYVGDCLLSIILSKILKAVSDQNPMSSSNNAALDLEVDSMMITKLQTPYNCLLLHLGI